MAQRTLTEQLQSEMSAWESAGLLRKLDAPNGRDFTTNDYLSLARDERLVEAAIAALREWGAGAGAARLLRGNLKPHREAENAAADWLGSEAALLFPSGWQANLAVLTTLAGRGDVLFSDSLNHASLIDGCRLSRARVAIFRHGDPDDLERQLRSAPNARRRIVVTESIFSMDGDAAPLRAYERLVREHDAWLVVDEAHAAGLYGPHGSGLCRELGADERVLARIATGGKALGVCGGFVAASRTTVELLVNHGRSFVFTTAPTPATAAALQAAIAVARAEPERRRRAHENAARLRSRLAERGVESAGASPIVPVVLGDSRRALTVAEDVRREGFDVRAVRPPTVPPGTSRLRVVCHADHSADEIDGLADAIATAVARHPGRESGVQRIVDPATLPLVVAGTDTGVGKTVVSALLARHLERAGKKPAYFKPIQTGSECDTAAVRAMTGLDAARAPDPGVALPLPASIDQAANEAGTTVTVEDLEARIESAIGDQPDARWILETAGGLLVPFNANQDQADLLRVLGLPVVLVARSGLGTLNHTRLTLEAAAQRGIAVLALFLVGEAHPANESTLRQWLDPLPMFRVPVFESLGVAAFDQWLDHNDLTEAIR